MTLTYLMFPVIPARCLFCSVNPACVLRVSPGFCRLPYARPIKRHTEKTRCANSRKIYYNILRHSLADGRQSRLQSTGVYEWIVESTLLMVEDAPSQDRRGYGESSPVQRAEGETAPSP